MRLQINRTVLELVQGDITRETVDAIVNAANNSLLGGGGVDGAIHRVAGPELVAETRTFGGCDTGDAKISKGYRLPTRHVIHTVGPIFDPRDPQVPRLLASAYRRSLEVALENGITSIAFPAISTGVFGYPVELAAPIAFHTIIDFCQKQTQIVLVRYVLFGSDALAQNKNALRAGASERDLVLMED
ncbi:MAG: O-acetyl-ADP-ribose deacetylase [Chloroflexi bacterium]|nr:O-acetyl-ADP-ribose deacetylase [Chloroflexota bacterium]